MEIDSTVVEIDYKDDGNYAPWAEVHWANGSVLNMKYGLLAFVIILIALAAFWFAGKVEERYNRKTS